MILTNNLKIYNQAKMLSQVSKKPHPWKYDYKGLGFNYRMPNLKVCVHENFVLENEAQK